ncbi:MAG: flagellar biosynthesis protein FliQ [Alphaproteobacteria bacterium]|nr:flagellar biosynthesis protein FliQ [Alphaproteobacteria bacterium]
MDVNDVLAVSRDAMWVTLKLSGPMMLVGLAVGLVVSLFQALTQIQEMTLAFVPKILAIFAIFLLMLPFMVSTMVGFTQELATRIVTGG